LMSKASTLILAIVFLVLLLATPHVDTQAQDEVEVKIKWVTYINPTDDEDIAFGTCVFGDYVAVIGEASDRPYVVLLRKSDGGVVREWIGSERGAFYNCISVGERLYAVGRIEVGYESYGVIYVFDVNLNILAKVRSESHSGYSSLVYDGKALYIGGWALEDVGDGRKEGVWLVEKRALDERLSLVNSKKIYFGSWEGGIILDIGVDPSTDRIWAVGYYIYRSSGYRSLIVILDGDLGVLKVIGYPDGSVGHLGWLTGIAFDGIYAYVSGWYGVAKFTVDRKLIAVNIAVNEKRVDLYFGNKVVYGYGYLYVFGTEDIRDYYRHMLYVYDIGLNLVKSYVLSEGVNANSYFESGRPILEGNSIYVAGIDDALGGGNSRAVVYSLLLEGVTATATPPSTPSIAAIAAVTGTPTVTASIAEKELRIATLIITKSQTTITDRMTTPAIIGLIAAGTLLAITTLILRR